MSEEKSSTKSSGVINDVENVDATVVDADTKDPHMHRSLKGRHVSMIAIVGPVTLSSESDSFPQGRNNWHWFIPWFW